MLYQKTKLILFGSESIIGHQICQHLTAVYFESLNNFADLQASNKYLSGPKAQHKKSDGSKGPAIDLQQPEAAYYFVMAKGNNFLGYAKMKYICSPNPLSAKRS